MAIPSIRDVAKQAQVSIGTVSNVLNRPSQVSEQTQLKVRKAIEMLGFIPNAGMKSKNTDSKVIGVILPLITASAIELSVCSGVGGCL